MIGITGGIASGKSTVAERLRYLGASVLNADQIAKEVVNVGTPGWQRVRETFPEVIEKKGEINRRKLGKIIFSNSLKRQQLEEIIHPLVRERMIDEGASLKKAGKLVFAEVPLLYEVGWDNWIHPVWLVYVRPEIQLERLLARNNLSKQEAHLMISAQISLEEKVHKAQVIIDNNESLAKTWVQVDALWKNLCTGM